MAAAPAIIGTSSSPIENPALLKRCGPAKRLLPLGVGDAPQVLFHGAVDGHRITSRARRRRDSIPNLLSSWGKEKICNSLETMPNSK